MLSNSRLGASPVFHFNMRPEFKARAALWADRSALTGKIGQGLSASVRNAVVGGVAGWGVVVVAGAFMMSHGAQDPVAPMPAAPIASPKPAPSPGIDTAPVAAISPVAPAPAPTPAKTTQRVDTSPTGAVADSAPKPKHKPHKKKVKDLDSDQ